MTGVQATLPTLTVALVTNRVPVMVKVVLPPVSPVSRVSGVTAVTVGPAYVTVDETVDVVGLAPESVTVTTTV